MEDNQSEPPMQYMPVILLEDLRVPLEEMAAVLRTNVFMAGKSPWPALKCLGGYNQDDDTWYVGFPLSAADFLLYGIFISEHLHRLCDPAEAVDGNEFLCCAGREVDGKFQTPADAIHAGLYLSADGGQKWGDAGQIRFDADRSDQAN